MKDKGYQKTVILKNWGIRPGEEVTQFSPQKGINIVYRQIDRKNKECLATLSGVERPDKPSQTIYKEDINNQLAALSKNILSDRARTVITKPQIRTIKTRKIRIQ